MEDFYGAGAPYQVKGGHGGHIQGDGLLEVVAGGLFIHLQPARERPPRPRSPKRPPAPRSKSPERFSELGDTLYFLASGGRKPLDEVDVLIDGVGGAGVPVGAGALLVGGQGVKASVQPPAKKTTSPKKP